MGLLSVKPFSRALQSVEPFPCNKRTVGIGALDGVYPATKSQSVWSLLTSLIKKVRPQVTKNPRLKSLDYLKLTCLDDRIDDVFTRRYMPFINFIQSGV